MLDPARLDTPGRYAAMGKSNAYANACRAGFGGFQTVGRGGKREICRAIFRG